MLSLLKVVPLLLSTAALVCLVVVFCGCTSPSSPQELFFLKVDLTEFPKGEHLSLRRSLNIPSTDTLPGSLETGSLVNIVSNPAEDAVDRLGEHVDNLTNRLKSLLPGYYAVGLWGYCEGEDNSKSFSRCSKPSASFSFDLEENFGARLGQANGVLSKLTQPVLKGYQHVSHWIVFAYLAGFIATFVAIVAGLIRFPIARMVILISSMASGAITSSKERC
ncbi:hypothetical protein V6Z77_003351 [Aspergillus fumigatus]|nr:hypothetical protein KXX38_004910 [Aspergillus fumigatus]KAH1384575.1 hypothetical protein KXX49_005115 [Aspergillus fumigatus]KAH2805287.1 hypothetical protein KXV23_000366 [Aspergillus fumigatus]KAH3101722.1 hypothetical protein KXX00_005975 [Aspergillus fumigatus]KAH3181276.1 hypothetical protein KXX02_004080 [Aspergillus fumigatus]